jgi:hypothetical protein
LYITSFAFSRAVGISWLNRSRACKLSLPSTFVVLR